MTYTSVNNEKIKNLRKLVQKKYRDETNLFLIEGMHLVIEAFRSGLLEEIIIEENEETSLQVATSYATKEVIKSLSTLQTPPSIIGVCKKKTQNDKTGNKILFLDNVQDPGNIGTIIRSAVAFNIDTIILNNCADMYNEKIIRATQGMIFNINIIEVDSTNIVEKLKNDDYKIYGTKVTDGVELKNVYKSEKFVIILGNEGKGVSEELLNLCDSYIYIKMNGLCESLNVAVAASIILYELDK